MALTSGTTLDPYQVTAKIGEGGRTDTFGRGSTRFELSPMAAQGGAGVQVPIFKLP